MPHTTDLDLTAKEVTELASPDAIAAFLAKLGYDTADRVLLSPEAVGLAGESATAVRRKNTAKPEASCRAIKSPSTWSSPGISANPPPPWC